MILFHLNESILEKLEREGRLMTLRKIAYQSEASVHLDLRNNNLLLIEEKTKPLLTARVISVSKSSRKQKKSMRKKEQNTEPVSISKQRTDQWETNKSSYWVTLR